MNESIFRWEREFTRTVLRLAIPIAVQSLVVAIMHILDNAMIGQLGEAQLAGVTQANRITFLLQVILFGLISGASIFIAQYWGKRDIKGIRSLMGITLLSAYAVALLFALPSLLAPEFLMSLLIDGAEAVRWGAQYLRIIAIVFLLYAYLLVQEAVLKSTEKVTLPTVSGIVAVLTSAALNLFLIFGSDGLLAACARNMEGGGVLGLLSEGLQWVLLHGPIPLLSRWIFGSERVPMLGVRGGAYATLIAVSLQVLITSLVSYARGYVNAVKLRELRIGNAEQVRRFYKTVLPVLLNEVIWSFGTVMYSVAYGRMGESAVAAMSVFSNVEQLAFVLLRGMTTACAVLVGKSIGAGVPELAQRDAKRMLASSLALGVLIGALVFLFAPNLVNMFPLAPETARTARMLIFYYAFFVWVAAGNNQLIVGILRSGGDVMYSGVLDTAFLWIVGVPLVFLAGPFWGWPLPFVFLVTKIEESLKLFFSFRRLKSGKWIHNLVEDSKPL